MITSPSLQTNPLPPLLQNVKRIVFAGDSLTDVDGYTEFTINTLKQNFDNAPFETFNAGIGGHTSSQLLERLQRDVIDRRPDLVTICIGTNDCLFNHPVEQYEQNLRQIIAKIIDSNAKLVMIVPSPIIDKQVDGRLQKYCEVVRGISADCALPCCDVYATFSGHPFPEKLLRPDGVHHTFEGLRMMAKALLETLGADDLEVATAIVPHTDILIDWERSTPLIGDKELMNTAAPALARNYKHCNRDQEYQKLSCWDRVLHTQGAFFGDHIENKNTPSASFGKTVYASDRHTKAVLGVGSYPWCVVWVNGTMVWKTVVYRGIHRNADFCDIQLRRGENEIVVLAPFAVFISISEMLADNHIRFYCAENQCATNN